MENFWSYGARTLELNSDCSHWSTVNLPYIVLSPSRCRTFFFLSSFFLGFWFGSNCSIGFSYNHLQSLFCFTLHSVVCTHVLVGLVSQKKAEFFQLSSAFAIHFLQKDSFQLSAFIRKYGSLLASAFGFQLA